MQPDINFDRICSKVGEASVIASVILDPARIAEVMNLLPSADSFFLPENKILYGIILKLYKDRQAIDGAIIHAHLARDSQLEAIGGVVYLKKLLYSVPTAANAVYYAKLVKRAAQERKIQTTTEAIQRYGLSTEDIESRIAEIQRLAASMQTEEQEELFVDAGMQATKSVMELKEPTKLVKTGFRTIDEFLYGFNAGQLIIVAGRPSMGKSSLAIDFALNMCKTTPVLFFTLESTPDELIRKCVFNRTDICTYREAMENEEKYRQIIMDTEEQFKQEYKGKLIFCSAGDTIDQQMNLYRQLKQKVDVGVVIIDYLQLMTGQNTSNRVAEVTEISRGLKRFAIKEQVPVIALSQLNRGVQMRNDKRPFLSDLRDSGSIEQDADVVMLLYRDDYYRTTDDKERLRLETGKENDGMAEINIAKTKNHGTRVLKMIFIEERSKFGDLSNGTYCKNI